MSNDIDHIVLIGGGLAAAKAAETVRGEGFDGHVTLVTDEPERPYERPPLSKGVLTGKHPVEDVYVHAADFYEQHDVDLVTGDAAVSIDRGTRGVRTASGRELTYDRLLLATSARRVASRSENRNWAGSSRCEHSPTAGTSPRS